jgi:hypothetical protein
MTTKRGARRAAQAPERHRNLPFVGLGLAAVVLAVVWWFAPAKAGELVTAFEILVGLIVGVAARRLLFSSDPSPPRLGYDAIASPARLVGAARPEELVELEKIVSNATFRTLGAQFSLRLLALELATARLERLGVDARDSRAAAAALGPQLWEFVRPDRARPKDWYEPGLGLETVEAVVERLEQL